MSLKFGIYLVEQRIVSPEQFCGLIKIQQESAMSLPTIAIRRNLLTIKQVARILTLMELNPACNFVETALSEKLIDKSDSERLIHEQLQSSPSIRKLVVECGLLTQHQADVLNFHFEKQLTQGMKSQLPAVKSEPTANAAPQEQPFTPPQPKFTQRSAANKVVSGHSLPLPQ